jgi:NADPH-dependent ferric siderophore reductase
VAAVEPFGAAMRRIRFVGDLADFNSAAPDDHVKLFLPDAAMEDGKPAMRDYTPRAFDRAAGLLTIDFALHGHGAEVGPATAWARVAAPGDVIQIGGPRGSTVIADDFDWYLLVGDETAIPAISRRIEELRADARIVAIVSVLQDLERPPMPSHPGLALQWSPREEEADGGATLLASLAEVTLPSGEGLVWIGAEAEAARAVRSVVTAERGHPAAWVKASGYWQAGERGAHTKIGDA